MAHETTSHATEAPPFFKDHGVDVQVHQLDSELDQKPLSSEVPTAQAVTPPSSHPAWIHIPPDFHYGEADGNLDPRPRQPLIAKPSAPLGVLANFKGEFVGSGFNLIFRPNSKPPTETTFPNPVTPAPPTPPSENVLELNLTSETLTFSTPLGSVPNRGLEQQNDIFLNGVPYVQSISDVTNVVTGKADGTPVAIHFEPGLWMHVPATTTDPILGESLVRMASIPHGTTINAQCLAPTTSIAGPPTNIPSVDISPFLIGGSQVNNIIPRFISTIAANNDTPRLPQDLTKFIAEKTITQEMLTDPNSVLRNLIKTQKIINTTTFTVSTIPASPELGGGVANIGFLQGLPGVQKTGGPQLGPNAVSAQMTATFWIETVQHELIVPPFKPGQPPLTLSPSSPAPGARVPAFTVTPPHEIIVPKTIIVHSTQIQYSQNVFLNFGGLTWPHVSVATLVPSTKLTVPPTAWV